jgi:aldose 1-epimerase
MAITKTPFGRADGKDVDLYTLTNANGLRMKVMTYGAIVTRLELPDRAGKVADVVLGFDDLRGYLDGRNPYFGAVVGRVANRIRDGRFELEGKRYRVATNDGPHHLHGGEKGWDKVIWDAEAKETSDGPVVKLRYVSRKGDEGYPGTVNASCVYALTKENILRVEMQAASDSVTLVNMAHHTYWNLSGEGSGPVTDEELTLHAGSYTPGDPMVPTGRIAAVRGTPFDFTSPKSIGADLTAAGGNPIGYDHNFVVDGEPGELRPVARLADRRTGRVLSLEANQPGVQLYTGNFLDGSIRGKAGEVYAQYTGLCLETQAFPNAINVPAWRNQTILRPGQTYRHVMIHRFTTE